MINTFNSASDPLLLPNKYWEMLNETEKNDFLRLKQSFDQGQQVSSKDRRVISFKKELFLVREFIERSKQNYEARCILTGLAFAGPLICVNTRQLKHFLSRCKSSINGSFQQLGYVTLKTKSKAKQCVITVLPSLNNFPNILRQWTVRIVSETSKFCFVSSFPTPKFSFTITDDDIFEERKNSSETPKHKNSTKFIPSKLPNKPKPNVPETVLSVFPLTKTKPPPTFPKLIEFDLPSISDFDDSEDENTRHLSSIPLSYSLNIIHEDTIWDDSPTLSGLTIPDALYIKRSLSSNFNTANEWDYLDSF